MDEIDNLAREIYQARSQSRQEMTDERWERTKRMFRTSVRICREEAKQILLEEEQDESVMYDERIWI